MSRLRAVTFALCLYACASTGASGDFDQRLKSFSAAQEAHLRTLEAKNQVRFDASIWEFLAAAKEGRWNAVTNSFRPMKKGEAQWEAAKLHPHVTAIAWPAIAEVGLATEVYLKLTPRYLAILTHDLTAHLPPGAVCFAGNDSGRVCAAVFSQSREQHKLIAFDLAAMGNPVQWKDLQVKFGSSIKLLADVDKRQHGRGIFDANPDRAFFVVEGHPLDWMNSHLSPHGAVLKLNREPIGKLTDEVLAQDRTFWSERVKQFLGADFAPPASLKEACDFVERVYVRSDLKGFGGDPRYLQNETVRRVYSKLRVAIAGNYFWRIDRSVSEPDERNRMTAEADRAFLQAFVLCPSSPEVVFRYLNLLTAMGRHDEALLMADVAFKLAPANNALKSLRPQLESIKAGASPKK
jgi:hypothetical protein